MKLPADVLYIFNSLKPSASWLVGGAVRDFLQTGTYPADIDIATQATPEEVMERLTTAGLYVVPTGLKHGTVTAVFKHKPYEITTLRKDVATHGRHADVTFTLDVEEDATRRDFTFNALYMDETGEILDFFGGKEDLKKGFVRFIGDAATRMDEDYLRILRYFRFQARFGKEGLSVLLQAPIKDVLTEKAPLLKNLSAERVTGELLKAMNVERIFSMWPFMHECGVLQALHLQEGYDLSVDVNTCGEFLRLAGIYHQNVDVLQKALKLSNAQKKVLKQFEKALSVNADIPMAVKLYRYGLQATHAATLVQGKPWPNYTEKDIPVFPLTGQDALNLGMSAGPQVGEAMKKMEAWWLAHNFPTKEICLEQLKKEPLK